MTEPYYQDDLVTLYHGDCREILADVRADVCITDPPYAVDRDGQMLGYVSPNWSEKATHSRGYADHDADAFAALLDGAWKAVRRTLPSGGMLCQFGGNRTIAQAISAAEHAGFQTLDLLVFLNTNGVAKSTTTLAPGHEIAALMRLPGSVTEINKRWTTSNVFDLGKLRTTVDHPTVKPARWMQTLVAMLSRPGEVVLDPFAGSGSTLVAAKMLGRKAIGVEIEEKYCEIAAQRLLQDALPFEVTA